MLLSGIAKLFLRSLLAWTTLESSQYIAANQGNEMQATTASLRKQAQQHESRREWMEARSCWLEAIRLYPAGSGALRAADIRRMDANADRCLSEFHRATDPAAQWVAKRDAAIKAA